ncbi:MAG: histidine kinase, partial [Verrucomicrobiota bacterium]
MPPLLRLLATLVGLLAAVLALGAGLTNSVLVSPRSSMGFGSSLAGGDFNGDGFGDLLIAEATPTLTEQPPGSLRLHLGSTHGISPEPVAVVTNLNFHRLHFLTTAPGAIDFDGDGSADVALTSQRWALPGGTLLTNDTAIILSGRALTRGQVEALWIGSRSDSPRRTLENGDPVHVLFPGPTHSESRGVCFALGDLDHDGHAEFAFRFPVSPGHNEVHVIWGRAGGSGEPRVTALAGQQGAGFGSAVAPWPDQDGDGVDDLAVSATSVSTRVTGGGEVEFWAVDAKRSARRSAFSLATPLPPLRPPSDHAMQHFGAWMVLLGPTQSPNRAELLVSAPWGEDGDIDEGVVRVYRPTGRKRGAEERSVLEGDRTYGKFGTQMIVPGDVNGDGWPDALIAAPEADHGQLMEGLAFLFAGSSRGLQPKPMWGFQGEETRARFGSSLAALGDVNRDGYADFAVGSPANRESDTSLGRVQVFYGAPDWPVLFEPIRWGKPWSRRLTDWWLSRWWWEQTLLGLGAVLACATMGAWVQDQWQRRTVIIVERRTEEARRSERQRVARDLHDEVGARLSHIHLLVEQLRRAPDSGLVRAQSDQLTASARDLRSSLEQVVSGLSDAPNTLDAFADLISRQAD